MSLKFLNFLYDINDLQISSEEILVDLLFNTYRKEIETQHSSINITICIYTYYLFNYFCFIIMNR